MAEVSLIGGIVEPGLNSATATMGVSEAFSRGVIPVVAAAIGGFVEPMVINYSPVAGGVHYIIPGVRQGVLAAAIGGLVDFTEWVWKIRLLPWCSIDVPVVRGLRVTVTPYCNDPSGREICLSIEWGDGAKSDDCISGVAAAHSYTSSGRYSIMVRAANRLGDSAALYRDILVVKLPTSDDPWHIAESPGSRSRECE